MKHYCIVLSLLFSFPLFGQPGQVDIPYYEPFEISTYDGCQPNSACQWQEQNGPVNNVGFEVKNTAYSRSIKLDVSVGDDPSDKRDRSEIAFWADNNFLARKSTFYYSWDFLIPRQTFVEDTTTDQFHFIMQFANDEFNTTFECQTQTPGVFNTEMFPPIILKYKPDNDSTTTTRDLILDYGTTYSRPGGAPCGDNGCAGPNGDTNYRGDLQHTIVDAINLNTWTHIVMKVTWSYIGSEAKITLWINDLPVVKENSDTPYPCFPDDEDNRLKIGTSSAPPYIFEDLPLMYRIDENGQEVTVQNYHKLGQYRKGYTNDHTIYFDNYRIAKEYPPSPTKTYLVDPDCNTLDGCDKGDPCVIDFVVGGDHIVTAYEIMPASHYVFKIVDGLTEFYDGSTTHTLDLLNEDWARAGKNYQISVRGVHTGFIHDKACTVNTPSTTRLISNYYNPHSNIPYYVPDNLYADGTISCIPLIGANKYKYRFTNTADITDFFYMETATGETSVNVYDSHHLKRNTKYAVQIRGMRIESNGSDSYSTLPYSTPSYIEIDDNPMLTKLTSTYCDQTITTTSIQCYAVIPADSYVFEFTDSSNNTEYAGSFSTTINPTTQSWFQYNELYTVKARAVYTNGVSGFPYGDACTLMITSTGGDEKFTSSGKKSLTSKPLVAPNPFSNYIEVKYLEETSYNYTVFNYIGALVKNGNTVTHKRIGVENLVSGVYFLKLENGENTFVYKLIKE